MIMNDYWIEPYQHEALGVFNRLVEVTGFDSFAIGDDFQTLAFGDDYEQEVTNQMWDEIGRKEKLHSEFVQWIGVNYCHEDGDNIDNLLEA